MCSAVVVEINESGERIRWRLNLNDTNFGTRRKKVLEFLFTGGNLVRVSRQLFLMNAICVRSGCGSSKQIRAALLNWMRSNAKRCVCNVFLLFFCTWLLMSRKSGELSKLMYHPNPSVLARSQQLLFVGFLSIRCVAVFFFLSRALPFWHVMGHLFGGVWVRVCWVGILCMLTWFA